MEGAIPQFEMLGIVALAAALGAIIGWEREEADKAAGLRTHMLVSGASAMLALLGNVTMGKYLELFPLQAISNDPLRVLNAIVIGVSFIGAGVILKDENDGKVRNLTTAASILFAAGVGVATALGQYWFAAGSSILVVLVTRGVYLLQRRYVGRDDGEQ